MTTRDIDWGDVHMAEGEMLSAIKRLRTQGYTYEEVLGVFTIHLYKEFKERH